MKRSRRDDSVTTSRLSSLRVQNFKNTTVELCSFDEDWTKKDKILQFLVVFDSTSDASCNAN
jgi:hypothetical protein